jgi:hypothetical protein
VEEDEKERQIKIKIKRGQVNDSLSVGTCTDLMMYPRQWCQKFLLLLVRCVGFFLEEEGI